MENLFLYSHQALAGYSLLQASSIYGESRIGWMTRDVHRITLLFMALNGAAFAYQASKLNTPSLATKTLALIPSTLAGLIYYLKGVQPQKGDPVEFDIENFVDQFDRKVDLQGTYTINKKDFPNSQVILQALILALTIQSAISLFFETNSPWNYLQLAGMGAALHQARQMDWIGVHHQSPITLGFSHQYPSAHKGLQPKITYYALLPTMKGGNEHCTICFSEQTDSYYCSNKHRYCKKCLETVFVTKIKELATQLTNQNRYDVVFEFTKPQYGVEYHSGTKFTFYFKEDEAPRCPNCREAPGHAYLSFKQGDAKIVNSPPRMDDWRT